MKNRQKNFRARAAAKAPNWVRVVAANKVTAEDARKHRDRTLGIFGAASGIRRIHPTTANLWKMKGMPIGDGKAEGSCEGVPYATELLNPNLSRIHFWFGEEPPTVERLAEVVATALWYRAIGNVTWSLGQPAGFWTHADMTGRRPHRGG